MERTMTLAHEKSAHLHENTQRGLKAFQLSGMKVYHLVTQNRRDAYKGVNGKVFMTKEVAIFQVITLCIHLECCPREYTKKPLGRHHSIFFYKYKLLSVITHYDRDKLTYPQGHIHTSQGHTHISIGTYTHNITGTYTHIIGTYIHTHKGTFYTESQPITLQPPHTVMFAQDCSLLLTKWFQMTLPDKIIWRSADGTQTVRWTCGS